MPNLQSDVPKVSRHVRGQAFGTIRGQQIWLGNYGQAVVQEKYDRFGSTWLATGRALPVPQLSPGRRCKAAD